jgi:hypothetical protein
MKGYLIGCVLIAVFICGFMMTTDEMNQSAPQMTINRPLSGGTGEVSVVLVGSLIIVLPCIAFAAVALLKSAPEAEEKTHIPGATGCASVLAIITGISVLLGFLLLGAMATIGGGG